MAGGLSAVFGLLADSWPAAVPLPTLRSEVGEDAIREALRLGLARRTPLVVDDVFPCRGHCSMRLIEDRGGLVAVCEHRPAQCVDALVPADEAFLVEFDVDTVVPALQRLLALGSAPYGGDGRRVILGTRRVGGAVARFVLVPRPARVIGGWVERFAREDPDRDVVVLAFATRTVPTDAPRRVDGVRIEWLGLDELWVGGSPDLSGLWAPKSARAPEPTFVVNRAAGLFSYAGVRIPLDRNPVAAQLLVTLLENAGEFVPRKDLLLALWPDEFDGKSLDFVALDRRLRQHKAVLTSLFRGLGLPDLIDSLRTRSDTDGGYRIAVDPEQVSILG